MPDIPALLIYIFRSRFSTSCFIPMEKINMCRLNTNTNMTLQTSLLPTHPSYSQLILPIPNSYYIFPNSSFLFPTHPILLPTHPILLSTDPILLPTHPIIFPTHPILLPTHPTLLPTHHSYLTLNSLYLTPK